MSTDLYQEIILEAARHPQHRGQLVDADHVVSELNASCGDQVTLYLKVSSETGQVIELKWEGTGCVISQAALSELAAKINAEQLTLSEIQALTKSDIEALLGIEEISPGRIKCLTLGLTAFSRLA
jgi:nitrogen fixation protein NifU and related proteins